MMREIRKRRSVRTYSKKGVEKKRIENIIWAGINAPSSADRRPVYFTVVSDKRILDSLSEITRWSSFVKHAPIAIIVHATMEDGRGKRWIEDCAVAASFMMLETVMQGLGSTWIQIREGERDDKKNPESIVKKACGMPTAHRVLCMLAIGHPRKKIKPRKKKDLIDEFRTKVARTHPKSL